MILAVVIIYSVVLAVGVIVGLASSFPDPGVPRHRRGGYDKYNAALICGIAVIWPFALIACAAFAVGVVAVSAPAAFAAARRKVLAAFEELEAGE